MQVGYGDKMLGLLAACCIVFAVGFSSVAAAKEMESSFARGAILYDKWYKVIKAEPPKEPHAAYPADKKYAKKAASNWRCKECHGWDYKGKDGAYASGKHHTGITGIDGMAGADPARVVAILKGDTHGYDGLMDEQDFVDLANFVTGGQVDMAKYIDPATKTVRGDRNKGEIYFNTTCAKCHGKDGLLPKDGEPLGAVVTSNPWEAMHKILNGQPGEQMPALRAFDRQIVVDIMAHMATLPTEKQ